MAKKHRKQLARLAARQKAFDALDTDAQRACTRPGSFKKSHPIGKKR